MVDPQRSIGFERALRQLAETALRRTSLEELFDHAGQAVGDGLAVRNVVLFESTGGDEGLRVRSARYRTLGLPLDLLRQFCVPAGTGSLPGYVELIGSPVASEDLLNDPRFTSQAPQARLSARAALAAPVLVDGGVWGVICAYDDDLRAWTAGEQDFIAALGVTLGGVIERDRADQADADAVARLDLALGAGGLGVWAWDLAGDTLELDPRARQIYGVADGEVADRGAFHRAVVHPDDVLQLGKDSIEAMRAVDDLHHVFRIIRPIDGEERWIESHGRVVRGEAGPIRLIGVVADVTARRCAEEQRELALDQEREARRAAERAREALEVLGEAGEVLSRSLDPQLVAEGLVSLCVPRLAEAVFVDVLDERGVLAESASGAVDPQVLADVRLIRRVRRSLEQSSPVWGQEQVLAGEAIERSHITADALREAAVDDAHLEALLRFGARAVLAVPLRARGELMGTLTLLGNGRRAAFDPEQRALAEILASRAALALDNSRLYASRHRVARSLQNALLPPVLPSIPGLEVAVRYQVAEDDIEIGGDFYDALEFPDGAWGVVIGDVCGRGPDAAALTGLIRHSIRAAAVAEREPSRVLQQTNAAVLDRIGDGRFCTASFVRVDGLRPASGRLALRVCSAGHPQPLIRRADGTVEEVRCSGSLLGVIESPRLVDVDIELFAGDALVLYTDGVTESRRGDELFGVDRLVDHLRSTPEVTAEGLAASVEAAASSFRDAPDDDLAVVVLRAARATD